MFIELMHEFDMDKTPDGAKWGGRLNRNAGDDGRIINCHTGGRSYPHLSFIINVYHKKKTL